MLVPVEVKQTRVFQLDPSVESSKGASIALMDAIYCLF